MTRAINKKPIIDPLESTTRLFDRWRVTREKRGPIPEPLWASAVLLADQYGYSKIVKALKLNGSDFKKRLKHKIVSNKKKQKPMQFIDCANQTLQSITPFNRQSCSIEFTCRNSSAVKLTGLSNTEVQAVITLLIGHS